VRISGILTGSSITVRDNLIQRARVLVIYSMAQRYSGLDFGLSLLLIPSYQLPPIYVAFINRNLHLIHFHIKNKTCNIRVSVIYRSIHVTIAEVQKQEVLHILNV